MWVDKAAAGIDFDPANLKLTSVKASRYFGLLQIGMIRSRSWSAAAR